MMLEQGNFASVDYLDDLVTESSDKEEKVSESKATEEDLKTIPTLKLEYSEMIRDYIINQKYDSEKVKNGVLQEFNEVIRIYDDNFKN